MFLQLLVFITLLTVAQGERQEDFYKVLGVSKDAKQKEIQRVCFEISQRSCALLSGTKPDDRLSEEKELSGIQTELQRGRRTSITSASLN